MRRIAIVLLALLAVGAWARGQSGVTSVMQPCNVYRDGRGTLECIDPPYKSQLVPISVPPFDVPPQQEWRPPLPKVLKNDGSWCSWDGDTQHEQMCIGGIIHKRYFTCTDKKRVLLTSEDGVKHCYDFGRIQ